MQKFLALLVKYVGIPLLHDVYKALSKFFKEIYEKRQKKRLEETKEEIAKAIKDGKKGDISRNLHDL